MFLSPEEIRTRTVVGKLQSQRDTAMTLYYMKSFHPEKWKILMFLNDSKRGNSARMMYTMPERCSEALAANVDVSGVMFLVAGQGRGAMHLLHRNPNSQETM